MEYHLRINDVDFTPYVAQRGMEWEDIVRKSRAVTVLNGASYRAEIVKRRGMVQLVSLPDRVWSRLRAALAQRPARVEYREANGEDIVKTFYVEGLREPIRTVEGGNTFYSGISFQLEEK